MESHGILRNRRFIVFVTVMSLVGVLYIALNVLVIGGTRGVIITNDLAAVSFSLLAFGLFLKVWLTIDANDLSRRIWGPFTLGLLLWTMAEMIWGFYEVVLGTETPYPSLADIFWVAGYVPLGMALITRYKVLNVRLGRRQGRVLTGLVTGFVLLTAIFVLKPIITEFDAGRVIESLLNVLYPLADLGLLILASLILFVLGSGRFRLTWGLIAIGVLFVSISDLFFSYMSWYEYLFPNGETDAATILVLTSYSLTYLWWAAGIYAFSLLLQVKRDVRLGVRSNELTRSNILVVVNARNQITVASQNLGLLTGSQKVPSNHMPLNEALGVDLDMIDQIMRVVMSRGSIRNFPLKIGSAGSRNVFLSALALINPQNEYFGAGIVLQANLIPRDGYEPSLTPEQKGLVESFLTGAGVGVEEDAQVLKSYFIEQIGALYALAYEFNGEYVANSLLSFIEQKAEENNWVMHVDGRDISIPEDYEGEILITCLSKLLNEARLYSINSASLLLVEQEMQNVDRSLNEGTLRIIDQYGFRLKKQVIL